MSIIIDLAMVAIITLFIFIGYKQGLVKVAIKILSFFIAIVVAFILYKPVSNIIINNTFIDDNIKNTIIERIKPQEIEQSDKIYFQNSLGDKIIGEANNTIEDIANAFSVKIIETSVMLLIFIIIKIALKFVSALTDIITKIPILKQINKLRAELYMEQ